MSKADYSGGNWSVSAPEGEGGYHVVSIGDNTEWSEVTFYGIRAKDNSHLFKSAPDMYEEIERDLIRLENSKGSFKVVPPEITREIKRKKKLLAKARGEQ